MAPTKVLITGVTGYIGGSILSQLLGSSLVDKDFQISVLTRNDDRAKSFASTGVKVYTLKDLDDSEAIKYAASENDVIIHTASGYHTASAKSLIEGLGVRKRQDPQAKAYYIHTSGTSNLGDRRISNPYMEPARVFSDKDVDIYPYLKLRERVEPYGQRTTDIAVVDTGIAQGVPTTIIMSPTIYGVGTGKFNRLSIQYPIQMKQAVASGQAEYVGDGEGVWDFVHILDLATLYELVLLDWVQGRRTIPVGETGFVFSGTGTFKWKEVADRIGKAGVELGKLRSSEARSISLEEASRIWTGGDKQLCELGFASTARTSADIGKGLGWRPTKAKEDWEQSFREEFEELLRRDYA
ncbi:NAD(P)-binding protein [Xylaria sp. FL1042]|nr:NAD(P)-binding protein [Xylaria sp. FL1042]